MRTTPSLEALQRLLRDERQLSTAQGWQRTLLTMAMSLLGMVIAERPAGTCCSVLLFFIAAASLSAVVFSLSIVGIWVGLTMPFFSLVLIGGSGIFGRGVQSQRHQMECVVCSAKPVLLQWPSSYGISAKTRSKTGASPDGSSG